MLSGLRKPEEDRAAAALLVLVACALLARAALTPPVAALMGRPTEVSGDEVVYLLLGDRLYHEGRYTAAGLEHVFERLGGVAPTYLSDPVFKHPPLVPAAVGASRALLGGTLGAAYWPLLIVSGASLAGIYWLSRELGAGPAASLAAVVLLAVNPAHWVSSTRIWLDVPVTALITLALAAGLRARTHHRLHAVAGLLWAGAILTKYVAGIAWIACGVATLCVDPPSRRSRRFWLGHALVVALAVPWMLYQLTADGVDLLHLARSPVDDWRAVGRAVRILPWCALVTLAAAWTGRLGGRFVTAAARDRAVMLVASALAILTIAWVGLPDALWTVPWTGWFRNELVDSSRAFYLTRQVAFEPIALLAFTALLFRPASPAFTIVVVVWGTLLAFLSAWGNFQLRYGLPLMPLQLAVAAALLDRLWQRDGTGWVRLGAATWVVISVARSASIVARTGTDMFYF